MSESKIARIGDKQGYEPWWREEQPTVRETKMLAHRQLHTLLERPQLPKADRMKLIQMALRLPDDIETAKGELVELMRRFNGAGSSDGVRQDAEDQDQK